jgi:hypothetical protein
MSHATGTPDVHRQLLTERYGPDLGAESEQLEPGRSVIIAALHSVAAFFADHMQVPMPRVVQLHCPVADRAELEALATAHNTAVYGDRPQVSIRLELPGVYVTVLLYVAPADRPLV